jgi:peptidyl-prolyl cis-trans isomerase B (cyclophilin B)
MKPLKKLLILAALAIMAALLLMILFSGEPEDPYAVIPNPIATITMDDGSVMRAELFLKSAPNTVSNFVVLANEGFYDGQKIYRIVNNGFIQTGDPTGTGLGGADYTIRGEFAANGFDNPITHERGVLSMARLVDDYNSASSQFFIMQGYYSEYDGLYAAFGKLMDDDSYATLDALGATPTDSSRNPLVNHTISSIRVETFGYNYEVKKIH